MDEVKVRKDKPRFYIRTVHQGGRAMQVTIPRPLAVEMEFAIGDRVQIYQVGRVLCVRRFDEGGFTPEVVAVRPGPVGERFG